MKWDRVVLGDARAVFDSTNRYRQWWQGSYVILINRSTHFCEEKVLIQKNLGGLFITFTVGGSSQVQCPAESLISSTIWWPTFDLIRTIEWFTWNLAENQWLIYPYPSCGIEIFSRYLNLTVFIFWLSFTKLSMRWNEGYGHWSLLPHHTLNIRNTLNICSPSHLQIVMISSTRPYFC